MSDQTLDRAQLRTKGMERLRSGEYPESIARDLMKQGLTTVEVENLFRDAASQQRRSGMFRIVAGLVLQFIMGAIVLGVRDAGYQIYGPIVLVGLFVLVSGILKIKNSGEIARAITAAGR